MPSEFDIELAFHRKIELYRLLDRDWTAREYTVSYTDFRYMIENLLLLKELFLLNGYRVYLTKKKDNYIMTVFLA